MYLNVRMPQKPDRPTVASGEDEDGKTADFGVALAPVAFLGAHAVGSTHCSVACCVCSLVYLLFLCTHLFPSNTCFFSPVYLFIPRGDPVRLTDVEVLCRFLCMSFPPCVFLIDPVHGTSVTVQGLPVCVPFSVYISCVFLIAPAHRTSV